LFQTDTAKEREHLKLTTSMTDQLTATSVLQEVASQYVVLISRCGINSVGNCCVTNDWSGCTEKTGFKALSDRFRWKRLLYELYCQCQYNVRKSWVRWESVRSIKAKQLIRKWNKHNCNCSLHLDCL